MSLYPQTNTYYHIVMMTITDKMICTAKNISYEFLRKGNTEKQQIATINIVACHI